MIPFDTSPAIDWSGFPAQLWAFAQSAGVDALAIAIAIGAALLLSWIMRRLIARVVDRIRRRHAVEVRDVRFLRAHTARRIKITVPGPGSSCAANSATSAPSNSASSAVGGPSNG